MSIVRGKCPCCGAAQNVNTSLRAANCTSCGRPYVVSDALVSPGLDAKTFLRKGKDYLRIGAVHKASECFMEGCAMDPSDDELRIFYKGFHYFDAEDYMKRHPTMEPYEIELLYLRTEEVLRQEYFMRFFDGSVYKVNPARTYADMLVSRKPYVVDAYRCDMCCKIMGGLPKISIFAPDAPGGLRSPEQVEYLFSRDKDKRFARQLYATYHFSAFPQTIFVPRNTIFGVVEDKKRVSYPDITVSPYDIIAGTYDLRNRPRISPDGEEIPFELRVAPNPEIARLIRRYYPR